MKDEPKFAVWKEGNVTHIMPESDYEAKKRWETIWEIMLLFSKTYEEAEKHYDKFYTFK